MGKNSHTTVRMGLMWDSESGRKRQVWGMLMALGYSRHSSLWPLFSQQLSDVIEGLESTWAFFNGIPRYLALAPLPGRFARPGIVFAICSDNGGNYHGDQNKGGIV